MAKITKNEQENLVKNYTKKPAYSNSRLDAHFVCTSNPKLSFDAMTIVGNLNQENAKELSKFMSIEPRVRLWDMLQTKFKAKKKKKKAMIITTMIIIIFLLFLLFLYIVSIPFKV